MLPKKYTQTIPKRGGWYCITHTDFEKEYFVNIQIDKFCGTPFCEHPPINKGDGSTLHISQDDKLWFAGPYPVPNAPLFER